MTQTTSCPACGAPLEYNGEHDVVHCPFCESEIEVYEADGERRFRVLAQHGPDQGDRADRVDRWNPDQGPQPQELGEPVAPGYATSGASMADPDALSPESQLPQTPLMTESIPESQAHVTRGSAGGEASVSGRGNTARWIGIGVAVFVVVCILCACLVAIVLMANFGPAYQ